MPEGMDPLAALLVTDADIAAFVVTTEDWDRDLERRAFAALLKSEADKRGMVGGQVLPTREPKWSEGGTIIKTAT